MLNLNILVSVIIVCFILLVILVFIPQSKVVELKVLSLIGSLFIFFLSMFLWLTFNNNTNEMVFVFHLDWFKFFSVQYSLGIDGISLFFILLTTFLIPVCILLSWESITYRVKEFLILLILTEFLLINVFSVLDLFFFYIFFESILIPIFLIIGVWGSRQRRVHAAYQFFFYTLAGSILLLLAICWISVRYQTTNIDFLFLMKIPIEYEVFLWWAFFISFAVKIPMIPVHIWLPEAHVEAPTAGSVLLAGVLLKLGTYGIIRFLLPTFPTLTVYYQPLLCTFCLVGVIYSSLTTIRQIDLKKIIAYSSIAHMNYALLGLFTNTSCGLEGSLYLMIGHGIVSSGLFICIGILYDRYHTRNILYYGGLVNFMPLFSIFFFILILANIGFPGTINFIGEFLTLVGIVDWGLFIGFFAGLSMVLGAVYSIWLYNRLMFGVLDLNETEKRSSLSLFCDLSRREFYLLLPFIYLTLILGIYPAPILDSLTFFVNNYISLTYVEHLELWNNIHSDGNLVCFDSAKKYGIFRRVPLGDVNCENDWEYFIFDKDSIVNR